VGFAKVCRVELGRATKCKRYEVPFAADGIETAVANRYGQDRARVKVNLTRSSGWSASYICGMSFCIIMAMAFIVCRGADGVIVEGIAAVVNGEPILASELNEAMAPYRAQFAGMYRGAELNDKLRAAALTLLNGLVDQRLMLQEAERLGLSVPSKSIDEGIDEIRARFSSVDEFRDAVAKAGDTEADVRDEVMKSLLLRQLIAGKRHQFEGQVSVSEQEVQEHLDMTPDADALTTQVELWQIWIAAAADAPDEKRADARQRCENILNELRNGADFEETARKMSEGPEREQGGLMGMVRQGEMQAQLDAAAFSLAVGETSDVVESPAGFHILRVGRIDKPERDQIADGRAAAEEKVRSGKVQKMYEQWLAELREKADISIKLTSAM